MNITDRTIHDVGLIVRLENEEALRQYIPHEIHENYKKKYLLGVAEQVNVFDCCI